MITSVLSDGESGPWQQWS